MSRPDSGGSVRFAVIGLGLMGRVHATGIRRSAGGALATVFDADPAAMERVSRELSVPASPDVESVLERADVEAVVLATPPSTHAGLIALAASAGKHVLCEKPLAATVSEGAAAVAAARRAGVELRVGFHRRFDTDFGTVKQKIAGGELGDPQLFVCSMRDPAPPEDDVVRSGEDRLIRDSLCHDLDCARWLMGEADSVTAHGSAEPGTVFEEAGEPDTAVLTLRFASGAIGAIDGTLRGGYFDSRVEIVGSDASVRVHGAYPARSFMDRFGGAYGPELAAFIDAVRGHGGGGADGDDALGTLRLCEAAEESLRAGGRKVTVPAASLPRDATAD
jgi:predicted dehydrogenase